MLIFTLYRFTHYVFSAYLRLITIWFHINVMVQPTPWHIPFACWYSHTMLTPWVHLYLIISFLQHSHSLIFFVPIIVTTIIPLIITSYVLLVLNYSMNILLTSILISIQPYLWYHNSFLDSLILLWCQRYYNNSCTFHKLSRW